MQGTVLGITDVACGVALMHLTAKWDGETIVGRACAEVADRGPAHA